MRNISIATSIKMHGLDYVININMTLLHVITITNNNAFIFDSISSYSNYEMQNEMILFPPAW